MKKNLNICYQTSILIDKQFLKQTLFTFFNELGVDSKISVTIIESVLEAEERGHKTHGLRQIPILVDKILKKQVSINLSYEIVRDSLATILLDGNNNIGYYVGYHGMSLAIERAKLYGVAVVSVRNSTHFGSAGFYSALASRRDMIGISMTNGRPFVSSNYGGSRLLGTNPICISFPSNKLEDEFLLDMSTSTVSYNKIKQFSDMSIPLPTYWGVDKNVGLDIYSERLKRIAKLWNHLRLFLIKLSMTKVTHDSYFARKIREISYLEEKVYIDLQDYYLKFQ